jgi:hypothetical protein
MVQIELSVSSAHFSLDLRSDRMDRSKCVVSHAENRAAQMSVHAKLVQQERRFYFIGRMKREVIFSVLAESLDDAWQQFRASGRSDSDALFIIKTETEIYLA